MSDEQRKTPEIAVMVSGRGSNLDAIFYAIERGALHARVTLVISSRSDAPALEIAHQHGAETRVIAPKTFASRAEAGAAIVAALHDAEVEAVALAGYKPILDASVVAAYPNRILNVHPSLLPAFAGGMAPKPQADALAAGVKISGCTVHIVTAEVDAGPIVAQAAVPCWTTTLWRRCQRASSPKSIAYYPLPSNGCSRIASVSVRSARG